MKRFITALLLATLFPLSASLFAAEAKTISKQKVKNKKIKTEAPAASESKVETKDSFVVQDIPKPEPIEGQLGEPGAPSLKEQQDLLAKSLLAKGLCNVSYYGEEFCAKQQARTFKVTNQLGASTPDSELLGEKTE